MLLSASFSPTRTVRGYKTTSVSGQSPKHILLMGLWGLTSQTSNQFSFAVRTFSHSRGMLPPDFPNVALYTVSPLLSPLHTAQQMNSAILFRPSQSLARGYEDQTDRLSCLRSLISRAQSDALWVSRTHYFGNFSLLGIFGVFVCSAGD